MAARSKVQQATKPDFEIRLDDGSVIAIEVKDVSRGIDVRDLVTRATMHISGASAASVGISSVFGWYVRADAPWVRGGESAIRSDWETVGDDLWRAAGEIALSAVDDDQPHLFDPGEYVRTER